MQITPVGLDLAKNIFRVHGGTESREMAFNGLLRRAEVLAFFQRLPPVLIRIEACASSHHWARELSKRGQTVCLMPPLYVKPYVKHGKSDAVDAEAICEAAHHARPRDSKTNDVMVDHAAATIRTLRRMSRAQLPVKQTGT
jgi:transposase